MLKSYYDILQIDEQASETEIKKQYRKLVRMYHPDLNTSLEAEEIFKEINKAADILLDKEKRKNYDNLRKIHLNLNKNKYCDNSTQYSFSDIFSKRKEKKQEEIKTPQNGENITVNITINTNEAILGTQRIINVSHCTVCPKCKGHKFINRQKCVYCNGLGEKTENRKITVKIPPSIKNKAKLRLQGEGKEGKYGGKNGNLYIIVNIEKKSEFKIENGIVYYNAKIAPYQAILGGNIQVATLWGEATIKIPPLTKSNQSFKLIDVGTINEKTGKKGDEIVNIIIQIPSSITDEEYSLYEKLKEINLKKKNANCI